MRKAWILAIGIAVMLASTGSGEDLLTLDFYVLSPTPQAAYALRHIVEEFNQAHEAIQVRLIQIGSIAQLTASVETGVPPQVAIIPLSHLTGPHYLTPLDASPAGDLLEIGGFKPEDFVEGLWNYGKLDTHQRLIPLNLYSWGLWYNKEIFRAAGLDPEKPPQTLADFVIYCQMIKAAGYVPFHIAEEGGPRDLRRCWFTLFAQTGGDLFDEGYTRATFNTPAGVATLQFLVNAFGAFGWSRLYSDGSALFLSGELGMLFGGSWLYGQAKEAGIEIGFDYIPLFFTERKVWGNAQGFGIPVQPAGTPESVYRAAIEAIRWILEHSYLFAEFGCGAVPAYLPVLESPELRETEAWEVAIAKTLEMYEAGWVQFPIFHPKHTELNRAIETYIQMAIHGEISAQEALSRAEEECNRILKEE